MTETNFVETY